MALVRRRPAAIADIFEIWDFIAEDRVSAADRWIDLLDQQFQLLATQPMLGRTRDELGPGIRSLPFGRYLIFYLAQPDGIDVIRILHGARDIASHFGSDR